MKKTILKEVDDFKLVRIDNEVKLCNKVYKTVRYEIQGKGVCSGYSGAVDDNDAIHWFNCELQKRY